MKLIGSSGSRGVKKSSNAKATATKAPAKKAKTTNKKKDTKAKGGFKKTAVKIAFAGLFILTAGYFGLMVFAKLAPKPPDQWVPTPIIPVIPTQQIEEPNNESTPTPDASVNTVNRVTSKYTFAIFGSDKVGGNTDVLMIATLDTATHKLNVVNIPRDTLVNVSWNTKKANSLYAYMKGAEGAVDKIADILGYKVDFYITVDMNAFRKIVDAVDGIWFDVPVNMNYEDPAQDLYIHISKGYQKLNGSDALKVVRFRDTYAQGDIKRISVTQDFLMSAAKQILEKKDKINITSIIDVFLNNVKTNLDMRNMMWLSSELFKLDMENITFTTMPGNYNVAINKNSYVAIDVDAWLTLLNEQLNPFDKPMKAGDLSILTFGADKKLYVTNGKREGDASWGASARYSSSASPTPSSCSSSSSTKTTPTATPAPTPTPVPTATPKPEQTPVPEPTAVPTEEILPNENNEVNETPPATGENENPAPDAEPTPPWEDNTPAVENDGEETGENGIEDVIEDVVENESENGDGGNPPVEDYAETEVTEDTEDNVENNNTDAEIGGLYYVFP